jgi:hypothetical protein
MDQDLARILGFAGRHHVATLCDPSQPVFISLNDKR